MSLHKHYSCCKWLTIYLWNLSAFCKNILRAFTELLIYINHYFIIRYIHIYYSSRSSRKPKDTIWQETSKKHLKNCLKKESNFNYDTGVKFLYFEEKHSKCEVLNLVQTVLLRIIDEKSMGMWPQPNPNIICFTNWNVGVTLQWQMDCRSTRRKRVQPKELPDAISQWCRRCIPKSTHKQT